MKKEKIFLITGITGMVGSHLADLLLKIEPQSLIYGACRWRSPLDNVNHLIPLVNNKKKIFFEYADLNDQNSLDLLIKRTKPDYIFHLAAQSFPQTSFTISTNTYDTNIIGTSRLLESVKKFGIDPVIHVCSSSEVFGRVSKKYIPIKENTPFHPASPYAISKAGTDLIARFFNEAYGMKTLITRMFTHTGPRRGDVFAESSFAKQIAMIEKGLQKPEIKVGNLNSMRTFADVRDAVHAYYIMVKNAKKFGEAYNIGGSYSCTVGEMLNKLIELSTFKSKIKIKVDKERLRPIDADLQIPDLTKFKKEFKWKPRISFEQTMIDLLDYWRTNLNGNIQRNFLER